MGVSAGKFNNRLPVKFLVLPCEWFDAAWVENPFNITWDNFFKKQMKLLILKIFFPEPLHFTGITVGQLMFIKKAL